MFRRLALAILVLLALVANPVAAAAAQASCSVDGSKSIAGMAGNRAQQSKSDPCCNGSSKEHGQKACADACATICGAAIAISAAQVDGRSVPDKAILIAAIARATLAFNRNLLDPPPKSVA